MGMGNYFGHSDSSNYTMSAAGMDDLRDTLNSMKIEDRVKELEKMLNLAQESINSGVKQTQQVREAYDWIQESYNKTKEAYDNLKNATEDLNEAQGTLAETMGAVYSLSSNLYEIGNMYNDAGAKKLIDDLIAINNQYTEGEIEAEKYFDFMQEKIKSIDFKGMNKEITDLQEEYMNVYNRLGESGAKTFEELKQKQSELTEEINKSQEKLEEYQRIFEEVAYSVANSMVDITNAYNQGEMKFTDYARNMKETAETNLELYKEINGITERTSEGWVDAAGNVYEYANSLQEAIDELEILSGSLNVFDKYWDTFKKFEDEAGNVLVKQSAITTDMINDVTNAMNTIINSSSEMSERVIHNIEEITNKTRNEFIETVNVNGEAVQKISQDFLKTEEGFNATVTAMRSQAQGSVQSISRAMGKVFIELGKAISNFRYKISVTPGIVSMSTSNKFLNMLGIYSIPHIGLRIRGEAESGSVSAALAQLGAELENYTPNNFTFGGYSPSSSGYTPVTSSGSSSGGSSGSSSSGGGSSGSSSGSTDRQAQEEYNNQLNAYKAYTDEKERLEQRWVNKQKELGQLSTKDFIFITEQRIERYKKYLNGLKDATWMSTEDRLALEKEYTEKIEDLQVDYLEYLKTQLNEQIKALQDANDKKIKMIKDEADTRINALKKVEAENDRIRAKEEYQQKRKENLENISYWEQRTGRQAQENLKEAKKSLGQLDKDWKQKQEDWNLDDQIKAIEKQRDAQVEAIEKAEEREIEALKAAFEAKAKLFAETGQLIYENAQMQSKALYNSYKSNFIDPILSELANLNATAKNKLANTTSTTSTTSKTSTSSSSSNPLSGSSTSNSILSKSVSDLATEVIRGVYGNGQARKNALGDRYAEVQAEVNRRYRIGQFHSGGIVGGNREGLALLKPSEVVLKPEWAASLNRMMKYFDNVSAGNLGNINNGPTIEVSGDLLKIEANVRNQTDINTLERKISKIINNKFNIKK